MKQLCIAVAMLLVCTNAYALDQNILYGECGINGTYSHNSNDLTSTDSSTAPAASSPYNTTYLNYQVNVHGGFFVYPGIELGLSIGYEQFTKDYTKTVGVVTTSTENSNYALLLLFTPKYHLFIKDSSFVPYLGLQGGFYSGKVSSSSTYSDIAHPTSNSSDTSTEAMSGIAYGADIGINIFVTDNLAFNAEGNYLATSSMTETLGGTNGNSYTWPSKQSIADSINKWSIQVGMSYFF
jgi:outer membrane protein W